MNLSLGGMALATLPPAVFALLLGVLLRQRSIAMSAIVFAVGGLVSFVLSTLLTRVSAGWIQEETATTSLSNAALDAMFAAALPEEAGRFLVLVAAYVCLWRFRRPADIILFGGLVGLGFAAVENVFYAFISFDLVDGMMRVIPTVSHGCDGLIMAAFLARATVTARRRWLFASLALIVPVLLHFLFDFGQFSADVLGPKIESVDPDADASPATLVLVGSALILMLLPIIVWVVEAVTAVLIVRRVRRVLQNYSTTHQPTVQT